MAAKVVEAPQLYKQSMDEFFKVAKYPLVKHCDMTVEMKEEAVDVCITAVEKFPDEREKCTQMIKDTMDKKFGPAWHVVVGKGFSYDVQYEVKNLLYLFVGGVTGVLLWKI
eukprot:jgi/Ulvmu1/1802/UM119_0020.1